MADCSKPKCMRPGRLTKNGYLNFLREFRKKQCGFTAVETVIRGAKAWNRLSCAQKLKYKKMGTKKKRKGCRPRRRPRPKKRCGKKPKRKMRPKKSCGSGGGGKCMKGGPVTSNAYLNFLRYFRRKNCGMGPNETVRKGARKWCSMTKEQKIRFIRMACKMSKSKRTRKSAICRRLLKKKRRGGKGCRPVVKRKKCRPVVKRKKC